MCIFNITLRHTYGSSVAVLQMPAVGVVSPRNIYIDPFYEVSQIVVPLF